MEKEIEYINTNDALDLFKKAKITKRGLFKPNRTTLIKWIKKYKLGRKFAGRFEVDKEKFIDFLDSGGYRK